MNDLMSTTTLPAFTTFIVRGERVLLDRDLARVFGVETRRLNEQVRRNENRFGGYAFTLSAEEADGLKSQFATSRTTRGGSRRPPRVFTEHGVVMAASVLNSEAAISAMKLVIDTFVRDRRAVQSPTTSLSASTPVVAHGLLPRLQAALEMLLATVVDHRSQVTVRQEAQQLLAQSIQHLKDRLGRPGLENEEIAARATKLLAEAEATKATAAKTQAEAEEIELRTLARRLRLVIEAERSIAAGELDRFLAVLEDLGRA